MNKRGFTLVEIMIIVAIISVLATIAMLNLSKAKISANEAAASSAMKNFASALEQYSMINGNYPTDLDQLIDASPPYYSENIFDGSVRNGYIFSIAGGAPSGGTYALTASPSACDSSGSKIFYINTGVSKSEAVCTP